MAVLDWLLDSDPSIRWQALRDLVGAPTEVVAAERARVATEGWGARLLALQGDEGQWEGGALFPARRVNPLAATRPTRTKASPGLPRHTLSCCCGTSGSDQRVDEAIQLLPSKRQPDGAWLPENSHHGKVHFMLEDGDGRPSRWNTLRALRVLRWYEQSAG